MSPGAAEYSSDGRDPAMPFLIATASLGIAVAVVVAGLFGPTTLELPSEDRVYWLVVAIAASNAVILVGAAVFHFGGLSHLQSGPAKFLLYSWTLCPICSGLIALTLGRSGVVAAAVAAGVLLANCVLYIAKRPHATSGRELPRQVPPHHHTGM